MKTNRKFKGITLCFLIAALWIAAGSSYAQTQDRSPGQSNKKEMVVLKIKKDINGKSVVIDTSFTINSANDHEALEAFLEQHEEELEALGDNLKDIDLTLSVSDSADADSMTVTAQAYSSGKGCPHFRWSDQSGAFNYDFDLPRPDDFEFDFPGHEEMMKYCIPGGNVRMMQFGSGGTTLADVIGDIPMDRVKSYSVKETKKGKKIVIEVENGPSVIDNDQVIVIQKDGGKGHKKQAREKQVRVIVTPEGQEIQEKN